VLQNAGIPMSFFLQQWPFFLLLDDQLTIISAGPSVTERLPSVVPGARFPDLFVIERPEAARAATYQAILEHRDVSYKVASIEKLADGCSLTLRGISVSYIPRSSSVPPSVPSPLSLVFSPSLPPASSLSLSRSLPLPLSLCHGGFYVLSLPVTLRHMILPSLPLFLPLSFAPSLSCSPSLTHLLSPLSNPALIPPALPPSVPNLIPRSNAMPQRKQPLNDAMPQQNLKPKP
jgi:hypothetical protein